MARKRRFLIYERSIKFQIVEDPGSILGQTFSSALLACDHDDFPVFEQVCVCVCLLILEGNFPPAIGKESRRRHRLAVIAQSRRASEGPKWEVRDQLFLEHSSVENNALGDQISQVFPPVWLRCVFFYSLGWRKQRKFACLVVFSSRSLYHL